MRKEKLITAGVFIFIFIIAGGIIFFKTYQGFGVKDTIAEETAKYIGENSVLYTQKGCIHCKEQEDLFGSNVKYLTIVDCFDSKNMPRCIDEDIELTPTWIIKGQKYVGVQSIEKLKELTGYQGG